MSDVTCDNAHIFYHATSVVTVPHFCFIKFITLDELQGRSQLRAGIESTMETPTNTEVWERGGGG